MCHCVILTGRHVSASSPLRLLSKVPIDPAPHVAAWLQQTSSAPMWLWCSSTTAPKTAILQQSILAPLWLAWVQSSKFSSLVCGFCIHSTTAEHDYWVSVCSSEINHPGCWAKPRAVTDSSHCTWTNRHKCGQKYADSLRSHRRDVKRPIATPCSMMWCRSKAADGDQAWLCLSSTLSTSGLMEFISDSCSANWENHLFMSHVVLGDFVRHERDKLK